MAHLKFDVDVYFTHRFLRWQSARNHGRYFDNTDQLEQTFSHEDVSNVSTWVKLFMGHLNSQLARLFDESDSNIERGIYRFRNAHDEIELRLSIVYTANGPTFISKQDWIKEQKDKRTKHFNYAPYCVDCARNRIFHSHASLKPSIAPYDGDAVDTFVKFIMDTIVAWHTGKELTEC